MCVRDCVFFYRLLPWVRMFRPSMPLAVVFAVRITTIAASATNANMVSSVTGTLLGMWSLVFIQCTLVLE